MPQFILKIDLGNDAAIDAHDVGDMVIKAGAEVMAGWMDRDIRDINGNVVGYYEVVD